MARNDELQREERKADAIELRRAGKSYREIAAELGCNASTALRDVKSYLRDLRESKAENGVH